MHDLEERLGHDATERAFRAYYEKWRFRHPSTADLREALAEATANRPAVEQVFRQNVYGVEAIDDRIESLVSVEEVPGPGTSLEAGQWVERTRGSVDDQVARARADFKKAHPDATHGEGPFPYRTTVVVRRDGARVPALLVVRFEDGETETVRWDDDSLWRRFIFIKSAQAKSAELDAERSIYLDYNKLNDGRTREPDRSASRRWAGDLSAIVEVLYSLWAAL
jgi:hypothetical protein